MTQAPDPQGARQALVLLRTRVDGHFDAALERQPQAFACREGCSRCCHTHFGVFELEAASLREALRALEGADPPLRDRIRAQGADPDLPHCPLLIDDRCSVYEARPIICRTHGLAVRTQPGAPEDHCPLNFQGEAPDPRGVLALDRLDATLSVAARIYDGEGERVPLAELARAPRGSP